MLGAYKNVSRETNFSPTYNLHRNHTTRTSAQFWGVGYIKYSNENDHKNGISIQCLTFWNEQILLNFFPNTTISTINEVKTSKKLSKRTRRKQETQAIEILNKYPLYYNYSSRVWN